jgi:type II secretory pathway component PulF
MIFSLSRPLWPRIVVFSLLVMFYLVYFIPKLAELFNSSVAPNYVMRKAMGGVFYGSIFYLLGAFVMIFLDGQSGRVILTSNRSYFILLGLGAFSFGCISLFSITLNAK